jgi:Leucine-rich repeat (LRR) protein
MKKLLLILIALPMIGFGQQTYVPDDSFEIYLEANGMGNGIANDDYVTTANINTVTYLDISNIGASNLTGIESFTDLTYLNCEGNPLSILDVSQNTSLTYLNCEDNQLTSLDLSNNTALIESKCQSNNLTSIDVSQNSALTILNCRSNQLTSLDVSNNLALTTLNCRSNQLTSLDVSQNSALTSLDCYGNQFISLDVSQNTALQYLHCYFNQLTSLDVSQNTALIELNCYSNQLTNLDVSNNLALTDLSCKNNQLTSLDVRNGNNINIDHSSYPGFKTENNPNLTCIDVDDVNYSTTNWTDIDPQHYFSNNCSGTTEIKEHPKNKSLLKVTGLLGRETKGTKNEVLFYIYDDGTVEKRIVIE